jgi:phosphoglycolate phosphatase-like HAD superfamily hydrolase
MTRAFEDVFGVRDAFRGIAMPGRTDAWILSRAATAHGISPSDPGLTQFRAVYLAHLSRELERPAPGQRKGVMPGVGELLDVLVQRDDYLALLTGNYEEAAQLKLEHFDLWRYFRCGAYGDDVPDRNALLSQALARVRACGGPAVSSREVVVIGDTPFDIACAAAGDARSLAVATGSHTVEALRAAGADAVFETLADTRAVLDAMERLTAADC